MTDHLTTHQRIYLASVDGEAHQSAMEIIGELDRETWRPIETAPKDGTRILVARAAAFVGNAIEIVEWCVIEQFHYEATGEGLYRKVADAPYEFWNGNWSRATHWMPLPDPPPSVAE